MSERSDYFSPLWDKEKTHGANDGTVGAELTPVSLDRAIQDFMAAIYGNRGIPMKGAVEISPSPEPLTGEGEPQK